MFKKIIVQLVIALIVFGISTPIITNVSFAQDSSTQSNTSTKKKDELGSFDVSEYLQIEGGQTYLETTTKDKDGKETGPNLNSGVVYFIIKLIELLTKIISSFALLFLITGGLVMMVSHGNAQMQTKGKQMILYSLLGLVVAFGSLIIVTFVQSLFFTM